MILTEEEVMILEDMKELEALQEEIELYLIEKYGLENLEEAGLWQNITRFGKWVASPFTRFSKHYIDRKGGVHYAWKDKNLLKRSKNGETLSPAEKKRVKKLGKLATEAKAAADEERDAEVAVRDARRTERSRKKSLDSESATFTRNKDLDITRAEEEEKFASIYGDGMDPDKAERQAAKNSKARRTRQNAVLSGTEAPKTATEKELVRSRSNIIQSGKDYAGARYNKARAEGRLADSQGATENLRHK